MYTLSQFEGVGVYYGATVIEAQMCEASEIVIVGGGNSAGQAAIFLSQTASHVQILIRSGNLAHTMSRYLIRRIEESGNITLHPHTELIELRGSGHLEGVTWRDNAKQISEERSIRHIYLMTGATPNTAWLSGCVAADQIGFIKNRRTQT